MNIIYTNFDFISEKNYEHGYHYKYEENLCLWLFE